MHAAAAVLSGRLCNSEHSAWSAVHRVTERAAQPCALCTQVFWMNHALRTLWPYYNKAIGKMVLEQAKPMIEEQIKPVSPFTAAIPAQGWWYFELGST